jgi:hypothetical protein
LLTIENRLFTERRIMFYGSGILIAYSFALTWQILARFVFSQALECNLDFCWEWVTGVFAVRDPAQIFNFSAFSADELTRLVGPPEEVLRSLKHFLYPPTLLLFLYPLGWMPYFTAFTVWVVTTLLLYEAAIYAIIPRVAALIAALTPFVVTENILLGHNGFLTAALIGFSLAFLERRVLLPGILLGLLTYKPQFGILFPVALLAARNWRAMVSAVVASVTFAVAAWIAFGAEGWPTFIRSLLDRNSTLSPVDGYVFVGQSVFGFLNWMGASSRISWGIHFSIAAVVVFIVFAVWARPIPYSLKASILCIGLIIVNPHVQEYDLCILSVGIAFLVKEGLSKGFLAGERAVMLLCVAATFFLTPVIGPLICAVILLLILRRIVACQWMLAPERLDLPI